MMIISFHTKGGSRDGVFSLRKPLILRCPFLYFPIIPWGKNLPSALIQCIWSTFRGWYGLIGLTITYVSSNCHTVDILWNVQVFYPLISYLEYICFCKVFHVLESLGAFVFSAIKATIIIGLSIMMSVLIAIQPTSYHYPKFEIVFK